MNRVLPRLREMLSFKKTRTKLLLSYVILAIIPYTIMGTYLYVRSVNSVKENMYNSITITMLQTKKNIEGLLGNIENLTLQIIGNYNIDDGIRSLQPTSHKTKSESIRYEKSIIEILKQYTVFTTDFNAMIYTGNGKILGSTSANLYRKSFDDFMALSAQNADIWLLQNDKFAPGFSNHNVFFVKKYTSPRSAADLGIVIVHLQDSFFDKIFKDIDLHGGYMFIMDSRGNLINETNNYLYKMKNPEFNKPVPLPYISRILNSVEGQFTENQEVIFHDSISQAGWKLVGVIPMNMVVKDLSFVKSNTLFFVMFLGLLSIISAYTLSSKLLTPLKKLQLAIDQFGRGDLNTSVEISTKDEFYQISQVFNNMVSRINTLVKDMYNVEREKRHAQLNALQSQINPHFLYNTMDTLRWISKSRGQDDLSQVILDLAEFFKIGLSKGKELITVEQELNHTTCYLNIQKFRYGNKIEYSVELSEDIKDCYIPKITIQPLVENAIYHGIKTKHGSGRIHIFGSIDTCYPELDNLVITVRDDGTGMDEETLARIRNEMFNPVAKKRDVYGLRNVHERVQLWFGNQYGLKLESAPGQGTCVIITIPVVKDGDRFERKNQGIDR